MTVKIKCVIVGLHYGGCNAHDREVRGSEAAGSGCAAKGNLYGRGVAGDWIFVAGARSDEVVRAEERAFCDTVVVDFQQCMSGRWCEPRLPAQCGRGSRVSARGRLQNRRPGLGGLVDQSLPQLLGHISIGHVGIERVAEGVEGEGGAISTLLAATFGGPAGYAGFRHEQAKLAGEAISTAHRLAGHSRKDIASRLSGLIPPIQPLFELGMNRAFHGAGRFPLNEGDRLAL